MRTLAPPRSSRLAHLAHPPLLALVASLALGSSACGDEDTAASLTLGLTTDLAVGFDLDRIEIAIAVDGAPAQTSHLSYDAGQLALPAEIAQLELGPASLVSVSVAAFHAEAAAPLTTRRASTRASPGRALLLPLSLDEACVGHPCAASETCVRGVCGDPFLPPSSLADYDATWIDRAEDACKKADSGAPTVVIGKGEEAFAPLEPSEIVEVEPGPQGGHHVWLALRATGLRQMGSRLTARGSFPELALSLPPATWSATLRTTASDPCELYGIRFQVDRGVALDALRGRALDLTLTLADPTGDEASATARVVIAP